MACAPVVMSFVALSVRCLSVAFLFLMNPCGAVCSEKKSATLNSIGHTKLRELLGSGTHAYHLPGLPIMQVPRYHTYYNSVRSASPKDILLHNPIRSLGRSEKRAQLYLALNACSLLCVYVAFQEIRRLFPVFWLHRIPRTILSHYAGPSYYNSVRTRSARQKICYLILMGCWSE